MAQEKWNRRYRQAAEAGRGPGEPSAILTEETAALSPGKALVLAAGTGRNALSLARRGWQVTAVDFSAEAVAQGRAFTRQAFPGQSPPPIEWHQADLLTYHPAPASFDLVTLIYLHLPSPHFRTVVHRAAAAVRPGGSLLIIGHDIQNLQHGGHGPQDPDLLYTPASLTALLAESPQSFTLERAETQNRSQDHGPAKPGARQRDCVLRAIQIS